MTDPQASLFDTAAPPEPRTLAAKPSPAPRGRRPAPIGQCHCDQDAKPDDDWLDGLKGRR